MRTAAIKFKNFVADAGVLRKEARHSILNVIIASFAMLAVIYFFILGVMVWNIIERKAAEAEAHTLASEVQELELAYIEHFKKVDLNLSRSLGFKEIEATFAEKKAFGAASVMSNEI